jgi:hypothetical protein
MKQNRILPPSATPSDEEPIAAGGWQLKRKHKF